MIKKCTCKYTKEGKQIGECWRCVKMQLDAVLRTKKKIHAELLKELPKFNIDDLFEHKVNGDYEKYKDQFPFELGKLQALSEVKQIIDKLMKK